MNRIRIVLKPGKEQSIQRFHPWVFSGAIKKVEGDPAEGDTVDVFSSEGQFLASGHFQPSSISVRIVTFKDEPIDRAFWANKLQLALNLRKSIGLFPSTTTNIFRLVHGEGDNMPGLVVDVYGSTAVMQCHSVGMYNIRELLAGSIIEILGGAIRSVYDKSSGTLPFKANIAHSDGYITGEHSEDTLFEHGNKFRVSWAEGQKTGFFIDQRENRKLLQEYSHGLRVLNTFGYTGGFSVYALKGGATHVVTVDSSEKAIALTEKNIEINFGRQANHQSINADVFEYLRNTNELFDLIVLDPPAFAKHGDALRNALQAYKRLNVAAIRRLNPGGVLFTFSCSQVVTKTDFRNAVFSACAITGRPARILHQLTQPADHPINIFHPEGEYLKGLVLQVE
jgi:23S rRNA (cytosine1962-C5)-methyltransferase